MSTVPKAPSNASKPAQNQSDVEKLRELKMTILRGQHPVFRPNPNPEALSQLFLGPHPAAQVNSGAQSKKPGDAQGNTNNADSKSPIAPLSAASNAPGSKSGLDSRVTRADPVPAPRPAQPSQTSERDRLRDLPPASRQQSVHAPSSTAPVRNGESFLRPGATASSAPLKHDPPKSSVTSTPSQPLVSARPSDRIPARPRSPTMPSPPVYSSLRPLGRSDPKDSTSMRRDSGPLSYDSPRPARQDSPKLRREGVPVYDSRPRQDSREQPSVRHEPLPPSYEYSRSRPETRNVSPIRRDSGPSHEQLGRPAPLPYSERRSSWDRSPPRRSSTSLEYHPFETRLDRDRSHERGRYERERERTQEPPRRPDPIDTRLASYVSRNPPPLDQRDSRDLSPDMRRSQPFPSSIQDPIRGRPESTRPLDVRGLDRLPVQSNAGVMRPPPPPSSVSRHDAPPLPTSLTARDMMPPPPAATRTVPTYGISADGRRSVIPDNRGLSVQREIPFPAHGASSDGRRSVIPDGSRPTIPEDDMRRPPVYTDRRQAYPPQTSVSIGRPESRASIHMQPSQTTHVSHSYPTTHAPPHADPDSVLGPIVRPSIAADPDDAYDPRRPANGIIQQRQHSLDPQPTHDPRRYADTASRATSFRDQLPPRPADELHPTPIHETVPLREPQPLPREATVLQHDISIPSTLTQHSPTQQQHQHQHQSSLPIPPASASLPAPPPPQLQMQRNDEAVRWARDEYSRPDLRDEYDRRPPPHPAPPLQATPMHSLDPRDYYERPAQPSSERDVSYDRSRDPWEDDAWREYTEDRERAVYGEASASTSAPLRSTATQSRDFYYEHSHAPQSQPSEPSSWGARTRPRSASLPHPDDERPYKRFRQSDREREFDYERSRERGAVVGHERERDYAARDTYPTYSYEDVARRDAYQSY